MATNQTSQLATAVAFFTRYAGYSYDAKKETKASGKLRNARSLAHAEEWARVALSFEWSVNRDSDSSEFSDEKPAWWLWSCVARGANGDAVASLHAIDFGRDGEPWGQPYKRVIEAELAVEAQANA